MWECGCGWQNGVNLEKCASCGRTVTEGSGRMVSEQDRFIDIVFEQPDGPDAAGRFVEVENAEGRSIRVGRWLTRPDGYLVLRLSALSPGSSAPNQETCGERHESGSTCVLVSNHGGRHRDSDNMRWPVFEAPIVSAPPDPAPLREALKQEAFFLASVGDGSYTATCEWDHLQDDLFAPGCPDAPPNWFHTTDLKGWQVCPYCKAPFSLASIPSQTEKT